MGCAVTEHPVSKGGLKLIEVQSRDLPVPGIDSVGPACVLRYTIDLHFPFRGPVNVGVAENYVNDFRPRDLKYALYSEESSALETSDHVVWFPPYTLAQCFLRDACLIQNVRQNECWFPNGCVPNPTMVSCVVWPTETVTTTQPSYVNALDLFFEFLLCKVVAKNDDRGPPCFDVDDRGRVRVSEPLVKSAAAAIELRN